MKRKIGSSSLAVAVMIGATCQRQGVRFVSSFRTVAFVPNTGRPSRAYKKHVRDSQQQIGIHSLLTSALSRASRTLVAGTANDPFGDSDSVQDLLAGAMNRANNTLRTLNTGRFSKTREHSVFNGSGSGEMRSRSQDLMNRAINRTKRTISTTTSSSTDAERDSTSELPSSQSTIAPHAKVATVTPTDLRYGQNPAISFTALAHWLWATVLRPHTDTAIDATCGNGYDSVGIANILFANEDLFLGDNNAELVCIDVQQQACDATKEALAAVLYPGTFARHVQILRQSHAPLTHPRNASSVGLVVYNLGYLPHSNTKECTTQVGSTAASIVDALLLIRLGGMVSIMTYPNTNPEEDFAVRALLEASVAMTNKQGPEWEVFVEDLECTRDLKNCLADQLRRLDTCYKQDSNVARTFRVAEHKKIGLAKSPILMTATRIK